MKMPAHELQKLIITQHAFLRSHGHEVSDVTTPALAYRVLHASGAFNALEPKLPGGYPDYNDAHIETAMKRAYPHLAF